MIWYREEGFIEDCPFTRTSDTIGIVVYEVGFTEDFPFTRTSVSGERQIAGCMHANRRTVRRSHTGMQGSVPLRSLNKQAARVHDRVAECGE